jgi:hypothetical protein
MSGEVGARWLASERVKRTLNTMKIHQRPEAWSFEMSGDADVLIWDSDPSKL